MKKILILGCFFLFGFFIAKNLKKKERNGRYIRTVPLRE